MKNKIFGMIIISLIIITAADAQEMTSREEAEQMLETFKSTGLLITHENVLAQDYNNTLVVVGDLDVYEQAVYDQMKGNLELAAKVTDEEAAAMDLSQYNLFLAGGPKHNIISKRYYDEGRIGFSRNMSRPAMTFLALDGDGTVMGSIYSYEYVPKKDVPASAFIPAEYLPAAAATTGILMAFLLRLFDFGKTATGEIAEELLAKLTHKSKLSRKKKKFALGFRKTEIAAIIFSIILFGAATAWTEVPGFAGFTNVILPYLFGAGLVLVAHELSHYFLAEKEGVKSEFGIWWVGVVSVLITSVLFGNVFAVPGRTLMKKKPKNALVFVSGPLISFLMGIVFFFMLGLPGFMGTTAKAGFTTAFIFAVYELLPISPMDGKEIWDWKKKAWMLIFVPILLIYAWFFLLG